MHTSNTITDLPSTSKKIKPFRKDVEGIRNKKFYIWFNNVYLNS
jgi:hypothetical protein